MTEQTSNPTDQNAAAPEDYARDFFALAKENPALRARIEKLIGDLDSFVSDAEALTAYRAARKAEREIEQRQAEDEHAALLEQYSVEALDEKRRRAWSIMGYLIWCSIIPVPDVDITARTRDTLDDLHAQQKVLAGIQYIVSHIEVALDQCLI